MRTSFFAPETATAETLKKDVRALADDTLKVARQQVVDPALEAARRASDYARNAVQETRERRRSATPLHNTIIPRAGF
jgi:hypothetical protein